MCRGGYRWRGGGGFRLGNGWLLIRSRRVDEVLIGISTKVVFEDVIVIIV